MLDVDRRRRLSMTDERMTGDRVIRLGQKPLKLAESCSCYRRPCDQLLRLWGSRQELLQEYETGSFRWTCRV